MKVDFEQGQVLVAQALTACDEHAVERAMMVLAVEKYANGDTFFFSAHKGDRSLIDRAILEIAKQITKGG